MTGMLLSGQVITVQPAFPQQNDTLTITFNAKAGNGALQGFVPVYTHTGVITQSGGTGNWQNVQGNWGTSDPKVLMTSLGNDRHQIKFHLPTFYGLSAGTVVTDLAFVFRDASGNTVGRTADGSDIFYPVYAANPGFLARFFAPSQSLVLDTGQLFSFYAASSQLADFKIYDNGVLQISDTNTKDLKSSFPVGVPGLHTVVMEADNGSSVLRDTAYYHVNPPVTVAAAPAGTEYGINYVNDSTLRLRLHAPFKNHIYVLGDFNRWMPDTAYFMRREPNGSDWWLEISGLQAQSYYGFQYLIDGVMRLADPYAELVLDPWNDPYIPASTFPNMPAYPLDKTSGIVSLLRTAAPAYPWKIQNFQAPDQEALVVYELLIRDFIAAHDYQTLIDTLGYIERLGVNAIELMPVNEFEGNESWGYNPSFHMALDKYYGPPEKFKAFVDECHRRGIAVILDIVLNHAFGQSPLVQMYFDPSAGPFGQPTSQNPWFNPTPRHDFNVGYDFNHASQATVDFVNKVVQYWFTEYHIDGYRFDLSKGFTQKNTLGNVAAWGAYDQSRVNILKRIKTEIEKVKPNAYLILEHFADNSEEQVLSDEGFLLWGNMNHEYSEASMGYRSNLSGISHQSRGFKDKHLVGYQESHDEERLVYKNLQFGNSFGNYNIRDLSTALNRKALSSAFLYSIPGPKMLWQFGELGYDVSITDPCRVCNKPIRWNYYQALGRQSLYQHTAEMIRLRQQYPLLFQTNNFTSRLNGFQKSVHLNGTNLNLTVLGNFDLQSATIPANFQHTGVWYEYFSGDSLVVQDVNAALPLAAGEYRYYFDQPVQRLPPLGQNAFTTSSAQWQVYPNPGTGRFTLSAEQAIYRSVQLRIFDQRGQIVHEAHWQVQGIPLKTLDLSGLSAGVYILELQKGADFQRKRLVINP